MGLGSGFSVSCGVVGCDVMLCEGGVGVGEADGWALGNRRAGFRGRGEVSVRFHVLYIAVAVLEEGSGWGEAGGVFACAGGYGGGGFGEGEEGGYCVD